MAHIKYLALLGNVDKLILATDTGDTTKVNRADTLLLKDYVRRSLLRIININLSKQDIATRLMESGFGSYKRIEK